jgi:hypothetical protein
MALQLDNTLSGETSNSYVDVAYCDAYWQQHYSTVRSALWAGLASDKKVLALIQACRTLESIRFTLPYSEHSKAHWYYNRSSARLIEHIDRKHPIKHLENQMLQFPRNIDMELETGDFYIPEAVMMAQCEQAVYLLSVDESAVENQIHGISQDSTAIGPISLKQTYTGSGRLLAPVARELLSPYFVRNTKLGRA